MLNGFFLSSAGFVATAFTVFARVAGLDGAGFVTDTAVSACREDSSDRPAFQDETSLRNWFFIASERMSSSLFGSP
ncbi:hypothetical protein [Rhodopila sp.]|uniref:hypothetical protein n=1 Tax=Rhodopila sp. TaxID=2480087 RepID=UPI003D12DB0F